MFDSSSSWFLYLLLAVPLVGWMLFRSGHTASVRFSMADSARHLESTWRQRSAWLLPVLRLVALSLLIVALARPREGLTQRSVDAEGIAIALVLDRSGSMDHDDYRMDGEWVTRLDAVKDVAGRFITGDALLPGRPADMIGVVAFARFAETINPLTLDHEYTLAHLEQTQVVGDFREDGTAIGDGLALAVANLHELERQQTLATNHESIEKVVVLLTDGENNAGEVDPLQAAELAKTFGVRVYVIGVRPREQAAPDIDLVDPDQSEHTLERVAELTGGQFFTASDVESLAAIYSEIDRLERIPFADRRYTDYREWAIEAFRWGPFAFPALAMAALVLLSIEMIASRTLYRRCP